MTDWIPVSERLPDSHTPVLVTIHDSATGESMVDKLVLSSRLSLIIYWHGHPFARVLAWMPLPEPWQRPE